MTAQRMVFLTAAGLIFSGTWLNGVNYNNYGYWMLYGTAGLLFFAFLTGICPGLLFWKKIGFK
ncbi:MAG: hypothetical protein DIZ80_08220 [endosymbiont of Galathealinum brachiosum]|uniref:DUF2892 domain-containing protein n=1 Tax=endosymbiont of Galathealinum brachiosum TaxID=2200906 RepID=A0A370DIJ0_9GAMM|nr:MAG: hypothetical protein DIZ80_08220 [endosymbiont of Galathealinum brachiosum]